MAAELEEIVLPTDSLDSEQFLPDPAHGPLDLTLRRLIYAAAVRISLRRRQCLAIQFAVRSQGHGIQHDNRRRHHVTRQLRLHVSAQLISRFLAFSAFQHDVGHQLLAVGPVLSSQHHRFLHRGVTQQHALEFSQLDPEAPHLHLGVCSPEVLQPPIRQIPHQISRPVESRAALLGVRVRHKPLRRQSRPAQIPARQSDSSYIQLAHHPHALYSTAAVQYVHLSVRHRTADRLYPVQLSVRVRRVRRRFRRSVQVIHSLDARLSIQLIHQRRLQRLPCQIHHAHRLRDRAAFQQRPTGRGNRIQQSHAVSTGHRLQRQRIRRHDARAASAQRQEHLVDRQVKTHGGARQYAASVRLAHLLCRPCEQ